MTEQTNEEIRAAVRTEYGNIARADAGGCCAPSCCGGDPQGTTSSRADGSLALGYSPADLAATPEGANMGLGCGNPHAIAALKAGETVLDLGAGGGFDCFLAAKQVGPTGRVIGVDMTAEMVTKARANVAKMKDADGLPHLAEVVDFRLGEIEHLPVADSTVDVILSNCVINLSPDKGAVFKDAYRVLKPGGRLAIADVVKTQALPPSMAADVAALVGCVSGAASVDELRMLLSEAGFENPRVEVNASSGAFISNWLPGTGVEKYLASATIEAVKPGGAKSCCGPSCCAPGTSA